jgi:glycosyltransferase involved in cell wall biosynthesis
VRILVANDGFQDAGGVQSYLEAVVGGLVARSHDVAMLYLDAPSGYSCGIPGAELAHFNVAQHGIEGAMASVRRWQPDACFSNNMRDLSVERGLLSVAPVVKFMHGYLGTCISGHKMFGFPAPQPCQRSFGGSCAALYLPRRCGQLGVSSLVRQLDWAYEQRSLFSSYRNIVVASGYMKAEFLNNGVDTSRVRVNPLFPTRAVTGSRIDPQPDSVAFMGRMTALKGGDLLVRAVADASSALGRSIALTMIGDGPQRPAWQQLARELDVPAEFVGWLGDDNRWSHLERASLLAVPSVWPEPFGLVGLEAASLGVPALAFDVGGVREWLTPGENGFLVAGDPPSVSALAAGLVRAFGGRELVRLRRGAVAAARRMSLSAHLDRLETILVCADPPGW